MQFTTVTDQGFRAEQQDRFHASDSKLIVCDGHGEHGHIFAEFLVKQDYPPEPEQITQLLQNFCNPQMDYLPKNLQGGTTFAAVFKKGNKFLAVMLGDSQIWYRRDGVVYELPTHSMAHQYNPDIPKLEDMGAEIIKSRGGTYYVGKNGNYLAMSRRFGDGHFGDLVVMEPDFYLFEADAIVVTSDGFKGSKKVVEKVLDKRGTANDLLLWQKPDLDDNFTAIVAY